ncbi:MAG: SEC-C domain-containing protein [Gemmatimonadaceae bacterium]
MTPAGRNDLCPCGSGKKFKKCHGAFAPAGDGPRAAIAPQSPEAARAHALKAVDVDLGERLPRFARSYFGPNWFANAVDAYFDVDGAGMLDVEVPIALPWMLFHLGDPPAKPTVASLWLHDRKTRASADQHVVLEAHAASWLSVWEVAEVQRGVGTKLVDLLTGEERFTYDVSSSQTLQPFDALLAYVVDCDTISFFGGSHAQPLPPREADIVVREARRLCRVRTRPPSKAKLQNPGTQLDLIITWTNVAESLRAAPPPTMTNTDGDPIAMTTDHFELLASRDDVARKLRLVEGAEKPEREGDDLVFAITKQGNAVHREWNNTVLARVVLSARGVQVETNSIPRADALRRAIEKQAGAVLRFRLRSEANMDFLINEAREERLAGKRPSADHMPPEALAAVREFRQRHMQSWLDDSIPALGGLTPREAARVPKARHALELLVKDIERAEARLPAAERIDVLRIRTELGMPRTGQ